MIAYVGPLVVAKQCLVFYNFFFCVCVWQTNVALDVIKKDYVSAALFAPGWVYETKQPPDFQSAQNRYFLKPIYTKKNIG